MGQAVIIAGINSGLVILGICCVYRGLFSDDGTKENFSEQFVFAGLLLDADHRFLQFGVGSADCVAAVLSTITTK